MFSESVCRELHLFSELRYILLQICNVSVKGGDAVDLTFYFVIPAYCPFTSPDKTIKESCTPEITKQVCSGCVVCLKLVLHGEDYELSQCIR